MSQVRRLPDIPVAQALGTSDQFPIWQDGRTRIGRLQDIIDAAVAGAVPLVPVPSKAAVGLGNVDNTSDTAKAAAGNPVGDAIAARQSKTYAQAGTGAVNALVDAKLKGLYVMAEEYDTENVLGIGGDATAALNRAGATGRRVLLLERPYVASRWVLPADTQGITGFGNRSVILGGAGGDATGDIITLDGKATIGSGPGVTNRAWNAVFEKFKISTSVNRTAGSAFLLKNTSNVTLFAVTVGDLKDLYGGQATGKFLFNGTTWLNLYHARMICCDHAGFNGTGVTAAGPDFGSEFEWSGAEVIQAADKGFLFGGGLGGIKLLSGGVSLCGSGVVANRTLSVDSNREFFIGAPFSGDSCTQRCWLFDDLSFGLIQADMLWACSAGRNAPGGIARGIEVTPNQVTNAIIRIGQLLAYNNVSDGACFFGGELAISGGDARINGGNGLVLGGGLVSVGLSNVGITGNTSYGLYVDPTLVTNAKAGNNPLVITGCRVRANGVANSFGLTGAPSGAYSVSGSVGLPMT